MRLRGRLSPPPVLCIKLIRSEDSLKGRGLKFGARQRSKELVELCLPRLVPKDGGDRLGGMVSILRQDFDPDSVDGIGAGPVDGLPGGKAQGRHRQPRLKTAPELLIVLPDQFVKR